MAKKEETKGKGARGEKIVTPIVRASFPYVHKPKTQGQYADNKYHVTGLIPKDRAAELKPLKEAILKVARELWPGVAYKDLQTPFKDGDEKADKKGYAGMISFEMKSDFKPGVIGPDRKDLPEGQTIYGGCWVRCSVVPYTYDNMKDVEVVDAKGKVKKEKRRVRGVSLGLQHVQFVRDDEAFGGGGGNPADDFDEVQSLDVGGDVDEDEEFEDDSPAKAEEEGEGDDGIL